MPTVLQNALSAQRVERARPVRPDGSAGKVKLFDGGGLLLVVKPGCNGKVIKNWIFKFAHGGKKPEMGLGSYPSVNLSAARAHAARLREKLSKLRDDPGGLDPLAQRKANRVAAKIAAAKRITFKPFAEDFLRTNEGSWKNDKHRQQWTNTLRTYAYPVLGNLPLGDIDTALVLRVLEPCWNDKPETMDRVRNRIEQILSAAKVRGLRSGDNPAAWRNHLENILPHKRKAQPIQHHRALPWQQVPALMTALEKQEGNAAKALRFLILCASRTGEVLGATWPEIDMEAEVWTIPAARMKAKKEHRVPLAPAALAILREMKVQRQSDDGYVFPGRQRGKPLSDMAMLTLLRRMKRDTTAHGMRSCFRDWAADSGVPREIAEAALAHTVNGVEGAYLRSDVLQRRATVMGNWAAHCTTPAASNVTKLRRRA